MRPHACRQACYNPPRGQRWISHSALASKLWQNPASHTPPFRNSGRNTAASDILEITPHFGGSVQPPPRTPRSDRLDFNTPLIYLATFEESVQPPPRTPGYRLDLNHPSMYLATFEGRKRSTAPTTPQVRSLGFNAPLDDMRKIVECDRCRMTI